MTPRPLARICALAVALALSTGPLAACGLQPSERVSEPAGPALSASLRGPSAPRADAAARSAPAAIGALEVRATHLSFAQSQIDVACPGLYRVRFINDDTLRHEIVFDDGSRLAAAPGETATALVNIPAEGSSFLSTMDAHREVGMVGQVSVTP